MVIIFKLDRFARNERDAYNNDYVLEKAGCDLVSYSEPMLDRSNAGRMMFAMLSGNNAYQSRNSGDEIKRKNLIKIQEGGTHGVARLGYKNVGEGGRRWVESDLEPFELIQWCYKAYDSGEWSVKALLEEATDRGLRTRGGPNTPKKPLSVSQLHRILRSAYYKGIVVYNGGEYQGKHEHCIDDETWQRVQDRLDTNRNGQKQREHHHYLKGTIWCGHCGARLIVTYAKGKLGKRYPYYLCVGRQQRRTTCMLKARPIELIEDQISEHYRQVQLNAKGVERAAKAVLDELAAERVDTERQRKRYERKLKQLEAERHKLMQAHYAGAVPVDLLKSEQGRITEELASVQSALQGTIASADKLRATADAAVAWLHKCYEAYLAASPHERRLMNQAFFRKVWVTEDGVVGWEYNAPFANLMRAHGAVEPIFTVELPPDTTNQSRHRRSTRYQRRSPGQQVTRAFFRQGLKENNLAGHSGLEPFTPFQPLYSLSEK